jgi:hypothetical protein
VTHDELLVRLEEKGSFNIALMKYSGVDVKGVRDIYRALDAIVKLHKPYKVDDVLLCDNEPYQYPCPTIQAIEKELG